MSLVWEIPFPTATQKLIMLRMSDYADDDGNSVFPSMDQIARQVGAKERATQYAVRALEGADLLRCVHKGGNGPQDTNRWMLGVDLLAQLALGERCLNGTHNCLEVVENKGANIAPRTLVRVQSALLRVQSATDKGAARCTRTTNNHQLESSNACASARESSRTWPAGKVRPAITLTPDLDRVQWRLWMDHLRDLEKHGLIRSAEVAGQIVVTSRVPKKGLQELLEPKLENYTDRITGEGTTA